MAASPLVSFCISTYRRPDILQAQLDSLLKQRYSNFEIVISDNDTECSAKPVAECFNDNRIRYYSNEVNLGMVKSFNQSVQRSKGDFVVMITDDDPAYEDLLEVLVDMSIRFPGYGYYCGCGDLVVQNQYASRTLGVDIGVVKKTLKNLPEGEIVLVEGRDLPCMYLDGYFSAAFLLWSCGMVRRDVITRIQGMPDYGSELLTDHAYVLAAGFIDGLVFINKSLGAQVVHGMNFGYDIEALKDKYLKTPATFYGYLKSYYVSLPDWYRIEPKIWNFIGRSYVEYSMMLYHSVRYDAHRKELFFSLLNKVFANGRMRKWKYKFYIKVFFPGLFKILLSLKSILFR